MSLARSPHLQFQILANKTPQGFAELPSISKEDRLRLWELNYQKALQKYQKDRKKHVSHPKVKAALTKAYASYKRGRHEAASVLNRTSFDGWTIHLHTRDEDAA